jgi:hypothetical protein
MKQRFRVLETDDPTKFIIDIDDDFVKEFFDLLGVKPHDEEAVNKKIEELIGNYLEFVSSGEP